MSTISDHDQVLFHIRCINVCDKITRDNMLRQGSPPDTIMEFVKLEMKQRDFEIAGLKNLINKVENIVGKALALGWYKDNPGVIEADGVCVGEHTVDTIVAELVKDYERVCAELARIENEREL